MLLKLTTAALAATTFLCLQPATARERYRPPTANDLARADIRAADKLRAEEEARSNDDGDSNKGWAYDVLFMRRSRGGTYMVVYPTRYGMFSSKGECEQERVDRISWMERKGNPPNDLNAPVQFPLQAWYSENSTRTEQSQSQAANSGGIQTTPAGETQVQDSGGTSSTSQSESRKGGDQRAMLFKDCVAYTYRQLSPIPRPRLDRGPGRTSHQRTENEQGQ